MPGGRPPKPTELKRRLGNPGKRRLPAKPDASAPAREIPPAPRGLKRHGKASWAQLWSVGEPWLNPTTDLQIVTRLCQAYDEREELRRIVGRLGHVVWEVVREVEQDDVEAEDGADLDGQANGLVPFPAKRQVDAQLEGQPHGGALKRRRYRHGKRIERVYSIKPNPAVQQLRKLEDQIIRMEGLCGFTPSDRTRLGLAQVKVRSALDEFLSQ